MGIPEIKKLTRSQPKIIIPLATVFRRGFDMANEMGKRYRCAKCGSELIVTRAGTGKLVCCKQPMEKKT
jgi:desulfoferrodoxin-like iron-binding protein